MNTTKSLILLALILWMGILSALVCHGQTNAVPQPDVQQAVGTLIHAIFPHISMEQIVAIVGAVVILARALRKAVPDNMQTALLGTILKHLALEINPVSTTPPPTPPATKP
jgi:hypothetical protein